MLLVETESTTNNLTIQQQFVLSFGTTKIKDIRLLITTILINITYNDVRGLT